jgi:hypothetical protein
MQHRPFEKLLADVPLAEPMEQEFRQIFDTTMAWLLKEHMAGRINAGRFINEVIRLEGLLPDGEGFRFSDYIS